MPHFMNSRPLWFGDIPKIALRARIVKLWSSLCKYYTVAPGSNPDVVIRTFSDSSKIASCARGFTCGPAYISAKYGPEIADARSYQDLERRELDSGRSNFGRRSDLSI